MHVRVIVGSADRVREEVSEEVGENVWVGLRVGPVGVCVWFRVLEKVPVPVREPVPVPVWVWVTLAVPVRLKVSEGVGSEGVKEGEGVTRDRDRVDNVVDSVRFIVGDTESEWECVCPDTVRVCVTLRLKLAVTDLLPDREGGGADPVVLADAE